MSRRAATLRAAAGSLVALALAALAVGTFAGTPPAPPPPPASLFADGALVLAQEDDRLAVALAARPHAGKLALQTIVLSQQRGPQPGLHVGFAVRSEHGRSTARASACGLGCYSAYLDVRGAPRAVTVSLGAGAGQQASRVAFTLPRAWPPKPALPLVRAAERAYARLGSLVTHERLASSPHEVVYTVYRAARPHRLRFDVRGGQSTIIIGRTRWDRPPGGAWTRSTFPEPVRAVAPYWTKDVHDAMLLGTGSLRGRPVAIVSFVNPRVPQWFTVWIDRATKETLQLRMTANAHFMRHVYGEFGRALHIVPPRLGSAGP